MNYSLTVKYINSGKSYNIKELTFLDFKNICKSLCYEDDPTRIINILDGIIYHLTDKDPQYIGIIDKILLLLDIRSITLGNTISYTIDNAKRNINVKVISEVLDKKTDNIEYDCGEYTLVFGIPNTFITEDTYFIDLLISAFKAYKSPKMTFNIDHLTIEEKTHIIERLPGVSLNDISKRFESLFESKTITISNNRNISPFSPSIIMFLKLCLTEQYSDIMNIEYSLRRELNLNTYDLQNMPYPECMVLYSKLNKEKSNREPLKTIGGNIKESS